MSALQSVFQRASASSASASASAAVAALKTKPSTGGVKHAPAVATKPTEAYRKKGPKAKPLPSSQPVNSPSPQVRAGDRAALQAQKMQLEKDEKKLLASYRASDAKQLATFKADMRPTKNRGSQAIQSIAKALKIASDNAGTILLMPRAPLARLFRELLADLAPTPGYKMQSDAITALHHVTELELERFAAKGAAMALHAGRETWMVRDTAGAQNILNIDKFEADALASVSRSDGAIREYRKVMNGRINARKAARETRLAALDADAASAESASGEDNEKEYEDIDPQVEAARALAMVAKQMNVGKKVSPSSASASSAPTPVFAKPATSPVASACASAFGSGAARSPVHASVDLSMDDDDDDDTKAQAASSSLAASVPLVPAVVAVSNPVPSPMEGVSLAPAAVVAEVVVVPAVAAVAPVPVVAEAAPAVADVPMVSVAAAPTAAVQSVPSVADATMAPVVDVAAALSEPKKTASRRKRPDPAQCEKRVSSRIAQKKSGPAANA